MNSMYKYIIKRILDFLFALVLLVVLLPLIAIIVLLLFLLTNENPFFLQRRPGKDERIFTLVKFRTMVDPVDKDGHLLTDQQRVTPIGRFLRKTSLDELPNLWNVLIGDMSLIGPRPLLVDYLPNYNDEQRLRHRVRPGITGWAQVNGRNALTWQEKFRMDVWYVNHLTFSLDVKIFFVTLRQLFSKESIRRTDETFSDWFSG